MNKLVQMEYSERCPFCRSSILHSIDNEVVCSRCGAVLGYSNDNTIQYKKGIEPNLYNTLHVGSEVYPVDGSGRSMRYCNRNMYLSNFSNLCERLSLPNYIALECWMYYSKLLKSVKMGAAELAMLVVYTVCKRCSLPRNEEEISDAIALVYSRRCLPTIEKVISNFTDEMYRCKDLSLIELYMQFLDMDCRSRRRARKVLSIIKDINLKKVIDVAC
ncbi:MAG: hypothetical protein ACK4FV_06055 [Candidatus Nitrosocaldus sp.]